MRRVSKDEDCARLTPTRMPINRAQFVWPSSGVSQPL